MRATGFALAASVGLVFLFVGVLATDDLTGGRETRSAVVVSLTYQPTTTNLTSDYSVVLDADGERVGFQVGREWWSKAKVGGRVAVFRRVGRWTGRVGPWQLE